MGAKQCQVDPQITSHRQGGGGAPCLHQVKSYCYRLFISSGACIKCTCFCLRTWLDPSVFESVLQELTWQSISVRQKFLAPSFTLSSFILFVSPISQVTKLKPKVSESRVIHLTFGPCSCFLKVIIVISLSRWTAFTWKAGVWGRAILCNLLVA